MPPNRANTDAPTRKEMDAFWSAVVALTPRPSAEQTVERTSNGWSMRQTKRSIGAAPSEREELTDLQFQSVVGSSRIETNHFYSVPVDPATNAPYLYGEQRQRQVGFGEELIYDFRAHQQLVDAGLMVDAQALIDDATVGLMPEQPTVCLTFLPPPTFSEQERYRLYHGRAELENQFTNVAGHKLLKPTAIGNQAGQFSWRSHTDPTTGLPYTLGDQLVDGTDGTASTIEGEIDGEISRFWSRRLFDPFDYTAGGYYKYYVRLAMVQPRWDAIS